MSLMNFFPDPKKSCTFEFHHFEIHHFCPSYHHFDNSRTISLGQDKCVSVVLFLYMYSTDNKNNNNKRKRKKLKEKVFYYKITVNK